MDEVRLDFPRVYKVERAGQEIGCAHGSPLVSGSYINIKADGDYVQQFDVLTDSQTRESFSVSAVFRGDHGGQEFLTVSVLHIAAPAAGQSVQSISIGSVTGDRNIIGNAKDVRIRVTADDILGLAGSLENGEREALCNLYQELKRCERERDLPDKSLLSKLKWFFGQHSDVINMLGQWFIMAVMNLE